MIWLLISRRVFMLLLVFFSCGFYLLYSFNLQLISDLNEAIRKDRLDEYGPRYQNGGSYRAKLASLLRLHAEKEHPKYRLQGQKPTRRLPNALIIGVKKCGTRALLEFIRLHPDVRAAGSEVHFFDKYYHKGYEWYRQKMPPTLDGQLTMEKTPSYWITRSAPRRVHAMNPHVKLLAVLRDPVTRALSDYAQAASKRPMAKFEELAFMNTSRSVGVDASWAPVRLGVYVRALRRWRRRFPSPRLLLVSGERLVADPAQEMARVQDFLGLKRVITEKHFYFNSSKGFPCLLKSESRPFPRCLGASKGRSHPQVSTADLQRLRDFYRPYNQRFYQLAEEDFGWP